jgi:competence protein ComEA
VDDRGWQVLAWGVAAAVAVLLALRLLGDDGPPPPVEVGAVSEVGAGRSSGRAAGPYVHVAGAVRRPGLYRLPSGARVAAAIRRAGGPLPTADLAAINLAARVEDGQQVVVPARAATGAVGGAAAAATAAGGPISLGTATVEQLERLDGIGPTLAERIVQHRQASGGFASLDQLAEVEGIGEKRLEALEQALTP